MTSAKKWAKKIGINFPEVIKLGIFGSYARGDWSVGSDLDLIMIIDKSCISFEKRATRYDTTQIIVPAELLVYTINEWNSMKDTRFYRMIENEAIWLFDKNS